MSVPAVLYTILYSILMTVPSLYSTDEEQITNVE